jgi:hypothetical protein
LVEAAMVFFREVDWQEEVRVLLYCLDAFSEAPEVQEVALFGHFHLYFAD